MNRNETVLRHMTCPATTSSFSGIFVGLFTAALLAVFALGFAQPCYAEAVDEPLAFEDGVILAKFEDGVSAGQALFTLAEESNLQGMIVIDELGDYYKLAVPAGVSVEDALSRIEGSSVVVSAQPNYMYRGLGVSSDDSADSNGLLAGSLVQSQAATNDTYVVADDGKGLTSQKLWNLTSVKAYDAWKKLGSAKKATVAVIDLGFDATHVDLKDNIDAGYSTATKKEGLTELASVNAEDTEHGTHVAGIVAAQANNAEGVAGVSYNAGLVLVKASTKVTKTQRNGATVETIVKESTTTADLVKGVQFVVTYAKNHPAANLHVINMSVGEWSPKASGDTALSSAINNAHNAGIVVVAAACNEGEYASAMRYAPFYSYPSDYENVVSVIGLTKKSDGSLRRGDFSNYNVSGQRTKNISAPGSDIYSTLPGNSYGAKTGTSMAAPQVAGVLALMFAKFPNLTADSAVSSLYSTATDLNYTYGTEKATSGWDRYTGFGLVNADRALSSSAVITGTTSIDVGGSTKLSWSYGSGGTWSSSNSHVASVDATGLVRGYNAGQAVITVANGSWKSTQVVTVTKPTLTGPSSILYGKSATYRMTMKASGGVTWRSSNTRVASVNQNGVVTATSPGTTVISATARNNAAIRAEIRVTVTRESLAGAAISLSQSYYEYDGTSKIPSFSIMLGGRMVPSSGYNVEWPEDLASAGDKTIVITGKGNYEGTRAVTYTVGKAGQPMTAKALTKKVKYSKVKKKKQVVARPIKISNSQGKLSYKLVKVNKKAAKKKITVNAKTGKVTVKKGLKKGTYKVKIRVTAAGNANYYAGAKTVTATIKVK